MKALSESKLPGKSSRTVTFRINSSTLAKLKEHARENRSTVNALVNNLLLHAIKWNITAAKSGWVPTERGVLRAILENLGNETIVGIAEREGKTLPRDICLSMYGACGIKEWLEVIKLRSAAAGFDLTTMRGKNESIFVLRHEMGEKFALHSKLFYESAFKNLGYKAVLEASENTLIFRIPDKLFSE